MALSFKAADEEVQQAREAYLKRKGGMPSTASIELPAAMVNALDSIMGITGEAPDARGFIETRVHDWLTSESHSGYLADHLDGQGFKNARKQIAPILKGYAATTA